MAHREDRPFHPFADDIKPNFLTPEEDFSKTELAKIASDGVRGTLAEEVRDLSRDDLEWDAAQIAKSHGIYLEWNRAKTGKEKDWMYMVRISVPGGGPLNAAQWAIFDELADEYTANLEGKPSLRITTRQNIQFHWVKKPAVVDLVGRIARTGFYSLNGCGDNVRNVVGCPASMHSTVYDAHSAASTFGAYFRLPSAPHVQVFGVDPEYIRTPEEHFSYGRNLLNRKFKLGFSAVHFDEASSRWVPDNCVELRSHDVGVAPILEGGSVSRFQVYIGGGQGEKNRKATFCALGEPFGVFHEEELLRGLDAIVKVQERWGDRENRHWSRLKYVLFKMGMEWFQREVRELGVEFEPPRADFDYGERHLHHGWSRQPDNGLYSFGAFIENGRIIDGPNGRLKAMVRHVMDTYPVNLMTTPNQDVIFTDVPAEARQEMEGDLARFGFGLRGGKEYSPLRLHSVACVGLDTCRLAFTEAEKFLPSLLDELEEMGYGELKESIGVSGCEAQCSRPATKALGWVGSAKNRYQLKLLGTEDCRHQGIPVSDASGKYYLMLVPREEVATVTKALFDNYLAGRRPGETLGYFHRRLGLDGVVSYLKENPATAHLMDKTYDHPNRG